MNGRVNLSVEVNSIYTLTTLSTGTKASPGNIPAEKPFPFPYSDNFDSKFKPAQFLLFFVGSYLALTYVLAPRNFYIIVVSI